ncbi:MAG TPA: hypothetical protein VM431_14680 [Phycisphaerae bacterium]|nr:hypothetical protein [Phycisphaerae bacterium]
MGGWSAFGWMVLGVLLTLGLAFMAVASLLAYYDLNPADAEIGNLKKTLRRTSEEKIAAECRIQELYHKLKAADAEIGNLKETLRQTPQEKAAVRTRRADDKTGYVTAVDTRAKTASINLGAEDGVAEGMEFMISNAAESLYMARLTIRKVSKKSAAGDLSLIRGSIKVNDAASRWPE